MTETVVRTSKHEFNPHVRMSNQRGDDSYIYIECTCGWKTNELESHKKSLKNHWEDARLHFESVTTPPEQIIKKVRNDHKKAVQSEQLFEW